MNFEKMPLDYFEYYSLNLEIFHHKKSFCSKSALKRPIPEEDVNTTLLCLLSNPNGPKTISLRHHLSYLKCVLFPALNFLTARLLNISIALA